MMSAPDEGAHAIRAAGVVRGQITAPHRELIIENWVQRVPEAYGHVQEALCYVGFPFAKVPVPPVDRTPACVPAFRGSSRLVKADTYQLRGTPHVYAFLGLLTLTGYATAVVAYRQATSLFGKAATASFVWSVAALLIAFLISAHKASWLPPRLLPRWRNGGNGNEPPPAPSAEASEPTS